MAKLRWGDDAPADAEAAKTRLIEAADACIDRFGLAKTTIEDIAAEAKVSRATIYRYFPNRDELVLRCCCAASNARWSGSLGDFFVGADHARLFGEALVRSAVYLLDAIRHDPKLETLLDHESGGISATITGASELLFHTVLDEWRAPLAAAQARRARSGRPRRRRAVRVDPARRSCRCSPSRVPNRTHPTTSVDCIATFLVPAVVALEHEPVRT